MILLLYMCVFLNLISFINISLLLINTNYINKIVNYEKIELSDTQTNQIKIKMKDNITTCKSTKQIAKTKKQTK